MGLAMTRLFLTILKQPEPNIAQLKNLIKSINSTLGYFDYTLFITEGTHVSNKLTIDTGGNQFDLVHIPPLNSIEDCFSALDSITSAIRSLIDNQPYDLTIGLVRSSSIMNMFIAMLLAFTNDPSDIVLFDLDSHDKWSSPMSLKSVYAAAQLQRSINNLPNAFITQQLIQSLRYLSSSLDKPDTIRRIDKIADELEIFSQMCRIPFPLDLMAHASHILSLLTELSMNNLPELVRSELLSLQGVLSFANNPTSNPVSHLTINSLRTQLDIAKWYLTNDMIGVSIALLSEIMINHILLTQKEDNWLGLNNRARISKMLNDLVLLNRNPDARNLLTDHLRELLGFWDTLQQAKDIVIKCGFSHARLDISSLRSIASDTIYYLDDLLSCKSNKEVEANKDD